MSTTVTIPTGARGCDYYALGPDQRRWITDPANRCSFVARYIAPGAGKGITADEIGWLHGQGKGILLVKEISTRDTDGGAAAGAAAATKARNDALAIGYPAGLSITMCADQDITTSRLPSAVAYMLAAQAALGPYKLGVYGDEDILSALAARGVEAVTCIPGALGWSPRLRQRIKAGLPWGLTPNMLQSFDKLAHVDPLQVFKPFGVWLPKADPPKPAPKPPTRPTLRRGSHDTAWVRLAQAAVGTTVDGNYGPVTEQAVRRYQARNHLAVDGVVGPQTWAAITAGKR